MSYRFHASAPPGQWINDPNALFFADGRYHLLVQHAADAPAFKRIGWGRLSSPDLMNWRWEGVVMPPEERASIYSGSLAAGGGERRLFFTRHDPDGPWQTQASALLSPNLAGTIAGPGPIGPAGRNVRDPFVYRIAGGWRMLVARPCDWTGWRGDPPSSLELWGSPDLVRWSKLATVGPWMEPGVMWEVPALIDFGHIQALILSLVDRRADTAECEVRYWLGRMTDQGFARYEGFPPDGIPLDHGPDFYAAIPNVPDGWPMPDRVVIGWASSWRTARLVPWPEARGGGPITMPRRVRLAGERLVLSPALNRDPDWMGRLEVGSRLSVTRGRAELRVEVSPDRLTIRRDLPDVSGFERGAPLPEKGGWEASLFADGPIVELFWRGTVITAALPGEEPVRIAEARAR